MVTLQQSPQLWLLPELRVEIPPAPGTDTDERWSNVPDFTGYQCSTLGRFRNSRTGQILRGTVAHNGYVHIGLSRNGQQLWRLAHRLIAATFLQRPQTDRELVVNHINQDRADNRTCNLEWVTRRDNAKHWLRLRG
ncbi:MAG: HNH endonuclease [Limisphaerales bacterium]